MFGARKLAQYIDAANTAIGRISAWFIVAAILISAGNAIIRKVFDKSSNTWLELQWYLFGAVFLLCAAWTLKSNEHIRIDVISSKLSPKTQNIIELAGHIFFLMPFVLLLSIQSWQYFLDAFFSNEMSSNAGGLVIWPARALIFAGFLLLSLQGLSQIIKRIAIMLNLETDDNAHISAHELAKAEAERLKSITPKSEG